jgi:hypothetical protein
MFTEGAAAAAGEGITAVIDAREPVRATDYPALEADGLTTAFRRTGHLVTASGRPVAAVESVYIPARVPPPVVRLLAMTAVPLGTALAPFRAWREELSPENGRTRGLLWLPGPWGDVPVALAWELIFQ